MNSLLRAYSGELPADLDTPISIYYSFAKGRKGVLFESRDQLKGRYSFIGRDPFLEISSRGKRVQITTPSESKTEEGKILDFVKEEISRYQIVNPSDYPFCGGAFGTVGYDVIRQYEELPNENPDPVGTPEAHLMFFKEMAVLDHLHQKLQIIVLEEDNSGGRKRALEKIKEYKEMIFKDYDLNKLRYRNNSETQIEAESNTAKEEYLSMVEKAKKYIDEGEIFQVVLSQRWTAETETSAFEFYRALRRINPSPYLYLLDFGSYQVAGSSPEMLVELNQNRISTCPIAGTRPRGGNDFEDHQLAVDLASDPKEKAEHLMLVDLARNDTGRVSEIGTVEVSEFMQVHYYSHVMHLVSLVNGMKKTEEDAFSILSAFIPAGTLSGAPKIRAMEIIDELEKEKRGIYGGAVGYFGFNGNMDMAIAIRTVIKKENRLWLQAGAGITIESDPEKEYQETLNKIRALMRALEQRREE